MLRVQENMWERVELSVISYINDSETLEGRGNAVS